MKLKMLKPRVQALPDRIRTAGSWRSAKTTGQRGYDYRWQVARAAYLRANPLCHYCLRDGHVIPATVVDHIVPHRGDECLFWNEANWQPLCKPHHDSEKKSRDSAPR